MFFEVLKFIVDLLSILICFAHLGHFPYDVAM